jgi:hypothetical protein
MTVQQFRIGEACYDRIEEALVACACGHTVLGNQAEEVWTEAGTVQQICDVCFFGEHTQGEQSPTGVAMITALIRHDPYLETLFNADLLCDRQRMNCP